MKFIINLNNNSTLKSFLLIGAFSFFATACGRMDVDTTAPIITLDTSEMEMMVNQGGSFTPPTASASDDRDGDISDKVVVSNSVDTSTPGIYKVLYTVADSAGNTASEVTVTVFVNGGTGSSDGDGSGDTDDGGSAALDIDCPEDAENDIVGCWQFLPEKNAFEVGPQKGDGGAWWANFLDDVTLRSCIFDDIFLFNADGSFQNVMGAETWLEEWQGSETPTCGAPLAPHDGSNPATYTYDSAANSITLDGLGAHIGLAKVYNGGELQEGFDPAAIDSSISYEVTEFSKNSMVLDISIGGGYWRFKLIRSGTYTATEDPNAPTNSDTFPAQLGSPADDSKWHQQIILPNGSGWFNNEEQHYTERNTYVSDGTLKIVAKKEEFTQQQETKQFTSSRLNSKYKFTYGKVEVRAKLPTGAGTWPAIWMLGVDVNERGAYWQTQGFGSTNWPAIGEIDIMEMWGRRQDFISSSLHTTSSNGSTVNTHELVVPGASTEFHTYAVDWNADRMVFSVDGNPHYTYEPTVKNDQNWPFYEDQYLILNIAIEGGTTDLVETQMEIDWVRIYAPDALPSDNPVWSDEFDY